MVLALAAAAGCALAVSDIRLAAIIVAVEPTGDSTVRGTGSSRPTRVRHISRD